MINISGTNKSVRASVRSDSDNFSPTLEIRLLAARDPDNNPDTINTTFDTVTRKIFDDEDVSTLPDLQVTGVEFLGEVTAGDPFNMRVQLLNTGDQRISSVPYRVELFIASDFSSGSRVFSQTFNSQTLIAPAPVPHTIFVPGSATTGLDGVRLFARVEVDPGNVRAESNENNNFGFGQTDTTEPPPRADLIISNVRLDSDNGALSAGDQVRLGFTVENIGEVNVGVTTRALVVVTGPNGFRFEDDVAVLPVAVGGSQFKQVIFSLPSGVSGTYTAQITADAAGNVTETSEANTLRTSFPVDVVNRAVALGDIIEIQREADGTYFVPYADLIANDDGGDFGPVTGEDIVGFTQGPTTTDGIVTNLMAQSGFQIQVADPVAATETSFTYSIGDGQGGVSSANVNVRYVGTIPVDQPPEAGDDQLTFSAFAPSGRYGVLSSVLLADDVDPEDGPLSIVSVQGAAGLSATLVSDGVLIESTDGLSGSFSYTVQDQAGNTDTASVSVTLPAAPEPEPNQAPEITVLTPQTTLVTGARIALADLLEAADVDGRVIAYALRDVEAGGAFLDADGAIVDDATETLASNRFENVFWQAGDAPGVYQIQVQAADEEGAFSNVRTLTLDVKPGQTGVKLPPTVSFDLEDRYFTGAVVALSDVVRFGDPNGREDITSFLIADYSFADTTSDGYLQNSRTRETLRATGGEVLQTTIDADELDDWVIVASQTPESQLDRFFVAPIDSEGRLPDDVQIGSMTGDPQSNLRLLVTREPELFVRDADGQIEGTENTSIPLSELVKLFSGVADLGVTIDGGAYFLENTNGQRITDQGLIDQNQITDWRVVFEDLPDGQLATNGTLLLQPFDSFGGGDVTGVSVQTLPDTEPGAPADPTTAFGYISAAVDRLFESPAQGIREVLEDLAQNNVKYILTFDISLKGIKAGVWPGAIGGSISFDLADLFGATVEGRGGYDGNQAGKISVWVGASGSVLSAGLSDFLPGAGNVPGNPASLSIAITPISVSPFSPDDRADLDLELASLKLNPVLGPGFEIAVDDQGFEFTPTLNAPFSQVALTDEALNRVAAGGVPPLPEFTPTDSLKVLDISASGLSFDKTFNVGEINKGLFVETPLVVLMSLLSEGPDAFLENYEAIGGQSSPLGDGNLYEPSGSDGYTGSFRDNVLKPTPLDQELNNTLEGLGGDDALYGFGGDDVLLGGDDYDKLYGGSGSDILDVGADGGIAFGGTGNDRYFFLRDNVSGQLGNTIWDQGADTDNDILYIFDTDNLFTSLGFFNRHELTADDLTFRPRGNDLEIQLDVPGFFLSTGRFSSDKTGTITIKDQGSLESRIEHIVLAKRDGDTRIPVSEPINLVEKAAAEGWFTDTIGLNTVALVQAGVQTGTAGADAFSGDDTAESFLTEAGDDLVLAGGGNDTITGGSGAGDDIYDGGEGDDLIIYSSALSGLLIDLPRGLVIGGPEIGSDIVSGIESVVAGDFNDEVLGDSADNSLAGAGGDDRLFGSDGDDTLDGGAGQNQLFGGAGTDTAVFDALSEDAVIEETPEFVIVEVEGQRSELQGVEALSFLDGPIDLINNNPPLLAVEDLLLEVGAVVALADIIQVLDFDFDPIVSYELRDDTGQDNWLVAGAPVDASNGVSVAELDAISLAADTTPGNQTLQLRVSDGEDESALVSFALETFQPNRAPIIGVPDQQIEIGQTVQLSDILSFADVDGDALAEITVTDSEGEANWLLDGQTVDAVNGVTVADVTRLSLSAGPEAGTQTLQVQVSDGEDQSTLESFTLTTVQPFDPFRVTTLLDVVDAEDGVTSLREALRTADQTDGHDTITFDASLNGGLLRLNGNPLTNLDAVTIDGAGRDITITGDADGNDVLQTGTNLTDIRASLGVTTQDNSLHFRADADLTLIGLTFTGGDSTAGGFSRSGGSIIVQQFNEPFASLRIVDSVFSGNGSESFVGAVGILRGGGSIEGSTFADNIGGSTGAIRASGDLTISGSSFVNNEGDRDGGAVFAFDNVSITSSVFSGNKAGQDGGAITGQGGLEVDGSEFRDNTAASDGGAIFVVSSGDKTITNSTIDGNTAVNGDAGGVFALGALTVTGSSITNNSATAQTSQATGGGVFANEITLINSEISGNTAVSLASETFGGGLFTGVGTIVNSVIAENTSVSATSQALGGGVYAGTSLEVTNSVVFGNQVAGFAPLAGGLFAENAIVTNTTITSNAASSGSIGVGLFADNDTTLRNSIISGNGTPDFVRDLFVRNAQTLEGGNIVGDALFNGADEVEAGLTAADIFAQTVPISFDTNRDGVADTLSPFIGGAGGDFGGMRVSVPISQGGPATDVGDVALLINPDGTPMQFDIRGEGFERVLGDAPDLGSFEAPVSGKTLTGTDQTDSLTGDLADDLINGGAGDDSIDAGGGNDVVDGGLGDDTLDGGVGIDTLSFASQEAPGFDFGGILFGAIVDLAMQGTAQDTGQGNDIFTNFENLEGSEFNDGLFGDDQDNTIEGADGRDFLTGEAGNDTLFGGANFDVVDGGDGADVLFGGTTGGGAIETDIVAYFTAGGPLNFVFGTSFSELEAGTSAEIIDDVIGADIEGVGGASNFSNTFNAENIPTTTFFLGGRESDTFFGGSGTDQLLGVAGDDVIYGNDGRDALIGEGGDDDLFGGAGDDFFFTDGVNEGDDTIHDLELGSGGDVIFFSGGNVTAVRLTDTDANGNGVTDTLLTYVVGGVDAGTITIIDHDAQAVLDDANFIGVTDIGLG